MQKFLATLFAFMAVAAAADFQIMNPTQTFNEGTVSTLYFTVKNLATTSLTSVSFVVSPEDSNVIIAYPNSQSSAIIGTIQKGASGDGTFYASGNAGFWNSTIRVSYKKNNVAYTSVVIASLNVVGQDNGGGSNGRSLIDAEEDSAVAVQSGLSTRTSTADIYTVNSGFNVQDSVPTWVQFSSKTNSYGINTVTFSIIPESSSVFVVYPSGTGNSLGSINANTQKDISIQLSGPAGDHSLNITYKYKRNGSSAWLYAWNVVPLWIYVEGATDGLGRREIEYDNEAPVFTHNQSFQNIYVAAAVAGVAVVAVVAVVGTVLYRKRVAYTTTSA